MKRMEIIPCLCLVFFALVLEGCSSAYDYYSTTAKLDRVNFDSAYWPGADSAIIAFAESDSISAFNFNGYEPSSKKIKKLPAKDSTIQIISVTASFENSAEALSIKLGMQYKSTSDQYDWYARGIGQSLFVDIYGCTDYGCKNAEQVVVHNEDYSYTRLIKKDKFEISEPKGKFYVREHGYDCDVTKEYFFHVVVDDDEIKLDMDVQRGSETCLERDAICYGFCG